MNKRDILMIVLALLVAVGVCLGVFFRRTMETGSWGLSFRQEGAPPVGNADKGELSRYDAFYLGDTGQKTVCLTFDVGYENGCTEKILDVLKKHDVKAAFFLVGDYIQRNADLVRRMAAEGHTVGNHTMHHPDMSAISDLAAFRTELEAVEKITEKYKYFCFIFCIFLPFLFLFFTKHILKGKVNHFKKRSVSNLTLFVSLPFYKYQQLYYK